MSYHMIRWCSHLYGFVWNSKQIVNCCCCHCYCCSCCCCKLQIFMLKEMCHFPFVTLDSSSFSNVDVLSIDSMTLWIFFIGWTSIRIACLFLFLFVSLFVFVFFVFFISIFVSTRLTLCALIRRKDLLLSLTVNRNANCSLWAIDLLKNDNIAMNVDNSFRWFCCFNEYYACKCM